MNVFDVGEATFEQDVLRRSEQVPVVVDFWAAWCGPCRTLGPLLERLAKEANGAWVLAKVDVDANQNLAAAFGIQGIPAVHAFRKGRRVAEFVGALPESAVRDWLARLGPSEADLLVEQAREAASGGDSDRAIAAYRRALGLEPGHEEARSELASLELAARAADADEHALRARLEADGTDVEAAAGLADLAFARGEVESAARLLVNSVSATSGDAREQARAHLVRLLETLPPDDARAVQARRALAAALF